MPGFGALGVYGGGGGPLTESRYTTSRRLLAEQIFIFRTIPRSGRRQGPRAESTHSRIQYLEPPTNEGCRMRGRSVRAAPTSERVILINRPIAQGSPMARVAGTDSRRAGRGGEGVVRAAMKNVTWQYECSSSLHIVLIEISRMQTAKRRENQRMGSLKRASGTVSPVSTKWTMGVARKSGTFLSSQNVNGFERKATAWRVRIRVTGVGFSVARVIGGGDDTASIEGKEPARTWNCYHIYDLRR